MRMYANWWQRVLLVVQLVVLLTCRSEAEDGPLVSTSLGVIEGTTMKSFSGKTINAFRGIPYAQPPVGNMRFAAPKPAQPWSSARFKATSDSLVCPQTGITLLMSEDCLKLNVFSKNLTAALPVIVYIHGGANVLGSGHSIYEAGPQYLLEHDVVLVAFNYRLGALGFLSGGNYGYLDQVLALKWVQLYIEDFGGNPNLVTIMGMSAGSMAVSLHLASPLSKGLFSRAILMSGSATNHYSIQNVFWTRLLARQVGCPIHGIYDLTECLRNVTWQRIVEVCASWEQYKFVNMKWNYEIDDNFLPNHPTYLIDNGKFNKVPLLVTYTANELDYSTLGQADNELLLHDINENFDDYAPELFLFDHDPVRSQRIKQFYVGHNQTDFVEELGIIFSDAILGHGIHRLVETARQHTPVYYARMDYVGERSLTAPLLDSNKRKGVGHADDLQYVMPGLWYGQLFDQNHTDVFMMERLTKWFTQFALTGNPMTDNQTWPACNATSAVQLYNDVTLRVDAPSYATRYELWDQLFPRRGNAAATIGPGHILAVTLLALLGLRLM